MEEIVGRGTYVESSEKFLAAFSGEWKRCRCQLLKFESNGQFCFVDNSSWRAMADGDFDRAIKLIPEARLVDRDIYEDFRDRGVDIIRCRPIEMPLSQYVKWEVQNYFVNMDYGERVFVCNYVAVKEFADRHANRDFIVFDARLAVVHDFDLEGTLQGGWVVENLEDILDLMAAFTFIKSQAHALALVYTRQVAHAYGS